RDQGQIAIEEAAGCDVMHVRGRKWVVNQTCR
ncbi:MAG: hypothetical protein ACI9JD_006319, partial [Rhodococcus sp. (in: high G+C Gram-positive bacteria)]